VVYATPRPLYHRERPGTHCQGSWVGFRADFDGCGKSHLSPEFDSRTVPDRSKSLHRLRSRGPYILISTISSYFYYELWLNVLATIRRYKVNPRNFLIPNGLQEENINTNISQQCTPIIQWRRANQGQGTKSCNKDFNHNISTLVGYAMATVKSYSPGKIAQEELWNYRYTLFSWMP